MAELPPFARQLRRLREAAGLTQRQLCERAGLSKSAVSHLESGKRRPTLETAHKLAQALGLNLNTWLRD